MIFSSHAIILKTIRYKETSLIITAYTQLHGLQSFIVSGIGRKQSKFKANLFQTFSILNVVYSYSNKPGLHRISEASIESPLFDLQTNITKNTIAQFCAEVVYKTIRGEETNDTLFIFLRSFIEYLEHSTGTIYNAHLIFLTQYSKYLGFFPHNNFNSNNTYFHPNLGLFVSSPEKSCFSQEESTLLLYSLDFSFTNQCIVDLNFINRKRLLLLWLTIYKSHNEYFIDLKTLPVLQSLFE